MTKNIRGLRMLTAPMMAAALVAPATSGCTSEDLAEAACGAELKAKADAFVGAVDALVKVAGEIKVDVFASCKAIAEAGGETVMGNAAEPSDDEVKAACASASAAINAQFMAAGMVSLTTTPGECRIDASAQASCQADCQVDASCTEPELDVRCEGGELSVKCEGTCMGTATCEGSAMLAAQCEGTCEATCEGSCAGECTGECMGECMAMNADGSCAGECMGTCNGVCKGTCSGTCTGKCELAADAQVTCNAEARCEGECMGTATAPTCSGTLTPPMCDVDAECSGSCEANAEFNAECTPPTVKLVASGMLDADFASTLEAELGVLLTVAEVRGQAFVDATGSVATNFEALAKGSAGCAAAFAGQIQAAIEASASVSVSVEASASASGSASSG